MSIMSDDKYIHKDVEDKIYSYWEKNNLFKPTKNKKQFSVVIPPPNVTGSLHMGHALNNSIQDLLVRYHRMNNYETLWQPGTDHAGIATQALVEKKLTAEGIDKNEIGREKFIEKVWEWKQEHGDIILNQLKKLGCSCDWSRNAFTMDENLSKSVLKVFVELHKKGLIYKAEKLVNWDTVLKTAISDLEVDQREVNSKIYYIQYPIDGTSDFITIATTRPETMLGDTAIAVNPKDDRFKKFVGKTVTIPIVDRKIKIIEDDYADPEQGTGALKITPAHDFNDFEVGKRNNLEFINIFNKFAQFNENVPDRFQGLDRYEARKMILKELVSLNLLIKEEKQNMVVPYGDRSGVVVEPWLTDQWFCDAKKLSIDPINAVKNGETKFVPKVWEKTFFNWMENIQPWCISRQLWWGHQIPAWYGPDKKFFVSESLEEANKKALRYYGKQVELIQDEDVLDTWFSSALWTFSTLDWPNNTYELEKFYPSNVLVTGFDIIFFWVARMMMMGSYFMKKTPFKHIYIHPLIRDEKGQKMSKSKGNVIDPLDLLDKYGADTLRFTLTALLNPGRDVKLSESRVKGYKSFTNKIWNASKFLQINHCIPQYDFDYTKVNSPINQWLINELANTKNNIKKYMSLYLFHEIANQIYHFVWHVFCDWYVEFAKSVFEEESKKSIETKHTSIWVFREILKLSHPIMPFITEKLWKVNFNQSSFLMNELNIDINTQENFNNSHIKFKKLIQIITSVRNLRSELNIPYKDKINLDIKDLDINFTKFIQSFEKEIIRLLKIENLSFNNADIQNEESANIILSTTTLVIPLKGIIDTKKELEKLSQKKVKELLDLKKLESKLNNQNFITKAPENIILQFKSQILDIKSSIEKIQQIMNTIK